MMRSLIKSAFHALKSIDRPILFSIAMLLASSNVTQDTHCLAKNRPSSVAKSAMPIIGKIQNPELLKIQGTYCNLHLLKDPKKSDVFLSVYQSNLKSTALMNIDGKDLTFASIREVKNKQGSIATYRSGNLNVQVTYIRTSPENEGASYDATILVSRGNQRKISKVMGACGI